MKKPAGKLATIDAYIQSTPAHVQKLLNQMRKAIQRAAPAASEKISYGIPTFYLEGNLVHFAAFKNHIGFYPGPSGITAFSKELSSYNSAKGSVQFPLDALLPLSLVNVIVKFRVAENLARVEKK